MTRSNPFGWIVYTALATGMILVSLFANDPPWLPPFALILGVAFGVAAGVSLLYWAASLVTTIRYDYRRSDSLTERVALTANIAKMTDEQLKFANDFVPRIEMAAGDAGAIYFLRVEGGEVIPLTFIEEFIAAGDENWLCPIRRFSEGSIQRGYAEKTTKWMIWMGYAGQGDGNRPAHWLDRPRALHALGIKLPDDPINPYEIVKGGI